MLTPAREMLKAIVLCFVTAVVLVAVMANGELVYAVET